jgi:Mn-dependent DtxR family transcriptional regulator
MELLRSDRYVLAAILALNDARETVSVRRIARVSSYNPTTVSMAIRRLRDGGYLKYRRDHGRHYTYTVVREPEIDMLSYIAAVTARL